MKTLSIVLLLAVGMDNHCCRAYVPNHCDPSFTKMHTFHQTLTPSSLLRNIEMPKLTPMDFIEAQLIYSCIHGKRKSSAVAKVLSEKRLKNMNEKVLTSNSHHTWFDV
eukprot:scaffold10241_cov256-Chaetoceros_neogracile.AAC.9